MCGVCGVCVCVAVCALACVCARGVSTINFAHRAIYRDGVRFSVQEAGACALQSRAQKMLRRIGFCERFNMGHACLVGAHSQIRFVVRSHPPFQECRGRHLRAWKSLTPIIICGPISLRSILAVLCHHSPLTSSDALTRRCGRHCFESSVT